MDDSSFIHGVIETSGIRMHIVERGTGPLILYYVTGGRKAATPSATNFALSDAGYRVVPRDQRGYGHTDRPDDFRTYTQL